jgi:hypothetical protein
LAKDADELVGEEVEAEVDLIRGEEVEEALHGIGDAFGVEGGEDEVAGL